MNKLTLFFLLFLCCLFANAQQQTTPKEFKAYKDSVNTVIKDLQKKVDDGKDALDKAEKVYTSTEKYIGLADRFDNHVIQIVGLIIALFGGTIAYSYNEVKNNLNKQLELHKEKLSNELNFYQQSLIDKFKAEIAVIDETFAKMRGELKLKKEKSILVLSNKNDDNDPINDLRKNRFMNADVVEFTAFDDKMVKNYDLIVFDNKNGNQAHWNLAEDAQMKAKVVAMFEALNKSNKKFIYYGDGKFDGRIKDNIPNITFCNDIINLEYYIIKLLS